MIVFHAREVHFEFTPATGQVPGQLLREGRPLDDPLPDNEMRLLECFVHHPEELLTREQLQKAIWGGRFMAHDTVDKAVSVLREAPGDSAQEQSFIETVRQSKTQRERGYKFAAKFKESPPIPPPPPPPRPRKSSITPAERDAIRAKRNDRLVAALERVAGIKKCVVFQLEDHTDKGYLIDVPFDPAMRSAAEAASLIRNTLDEMARPVPFWGQIMTESDASVSFGYTYLDEHNKAVRDRALPQPPEGPAEQDAPDQRWQLNVTGDSVRFKLKWSKPPYTAWAIHVDQPLFEHYPGDWCYRGSVGSECPDLYRELLAGPGITSVSRAGPYAISIGTAEFAEPEPAALYFMDKLKTAAHIGQVFYSVEPSLKLRRAGRRPPPDSAT